jgi:uncharacterized protein (TIGR00725 family)
MYVGVIGTGDYEPELYKDAYEVGRLLAERGAVVVCGGLGGVMEAACKGASEAGGVSIGFLPGYSRSEGNPFATYLLPTGLGEMRNLLIIRASDAVIAIGGGFGTLSEIGFALKTGKKIVLLKSWECIDKENRYAKSVIYAKDPHEAVEKIFSE